MEFIREHILLNKIIIVDGIGKCGKSLALDIISCFHAVEKQEFNSFIEYIALAHHYNKISPDIAIAILQTEIDTELYNNMIGRYINTRLTDATSLYNYHNPSKYLNRTLSEEGTCIKEKVANEKPIYLCWSHNLISKSDIIWEAYHKKLAWIYVNRKPINIIDDWNKIQISERMARDPTEMQYNFKYKDTSLPEIARGWEDEFLTIKPADRLVKIIYNFFKVNRDALIKKKLENKNLHIINFEDLVTNPFKEIEKFKNITGNNFLPVMEQVLAKAKCPRKLYEEEWQEKENNFKKNISEKYVEMLSEINDLYEDIKQLASI